MRLIARLRVDPPLLGLGRPRRTLQLSAKLHQSLALLPQKGLIETGRASFHEALLEGMT
jgi:hypothetical protein